MIFRKSILLGAIINLLQTRRQARSAGFLLDSRTRLILCVCTCHYYRFACSSLRSESLKSSRSNKCTSHLSFAAVERCLAPSKTTTFALKAVGLAALNSITAQHCNLSPRHRLVKHDTEPAWRWHSVCNDCHSPREREPAPNLI